MKKVIGCAMLVGFFMAPHAKAQKKEFSEVIKKELTYAYSNGNPMLEIQNLNGSISVEGYQGDRVLLEVEKTIMASTSKDLELGKNEIGIKTVQEGDKLIIYPDSPHMHYKDGRLTSKDCDRWQESPYEHILNFKVKMPERINLKVGAINRGEVLVKNTKGDYIEAHNINGGIELINITGQTKVHCINGKVDVSYANNPTAASTYFSLNKDINITYQSDLSADIVFKSMNGELFTDFDVARQFAKTVKNKADGKNSKYKYESKPVVQIGQGGPSFDFETLNGDVIITKI